MYLAQAPGELVVATPAPVSVQTSTNALPWVLVAVLVLLVIYLMSKRQWQQ